MPVKLWSISKRQPFTEEVAFNFDDHVNLFIGPNATGKSTLIRKLWADHLNQASILVPANRLGLPFLYDDAGHQALVKDNEERECTPQPNGCESVRFRRQTHAFHQTFNGSRGSTWFSIW